ncbi:MULTISPECIES: phage antirepressor KilAC domain-containing protein [unclassified Mammaliicoccus]|uniref:phage antirepressor KilAC domain-containing protein n=1 Tax=unclassified Mammaliicoccus TaxID=2803851 RepID=UPI0018B0B87E|nr:MULTISPECIES: phage antirepressor KilAC domain-containing protein [unclassified Mammaliicoccus]MBF9297235.1 phage antirepressor KilAC domain-containing protein [Staphylococcus schleiferi]
MSATLKVIEQNKELYVDSREVAEMIGKKHSHLTRDIQNYETVILQNPKLDSADFFIESSYKSNNNNSYKHYLLTKKGCDMVANKMTGERGILFTATYVDAFYQMQEQIKQTAISMSDSYMIEDPVQRAKRWIEEQQEKLMLEQEIGELKPKADYVDEILKSNGTMTATQIAADYGLSANKLNKILNEARLQRKVGNQWILYKEHMNKGLTKSNTISIVRSDGRQDTKLQTKWTQKGRLKIHEILTEKGYEAQLSSEIA